MVPVDTSLGEVEVGFQRPFNPLQPYHNHLYTSISTQPQSQHTQSVNPEKLGWRTSRQVFSNAEAHSDNMKRRASRLGVFSLFHRNKIPESGAEENKLETIFGGNEIDGSGLEKAGDTSLMNLHDSGPRQTSETSRESQNEPLRHRASKRALKAKDSFARHKDTRWELPPLFQAYPQSVKYATLSSPTLPADTIVRLNQEQQMLNAKQTYGNDGIKISGRSKDKKLRKASTLDAVINGDWTEKIYVLLTEGYLLQYEGHGFHDRAPEKILPLNKDSAAFASDAIPGKPFVLQVSQISHEDDTVNTETSKDILRKAGLRIESRRSASTLFLVLASPEEMNAWLVAVRKKIEALGGRAYKQEVFGTDGMQAQRGEGRGPDIMRIPSQRYLVKREPHRFSHAPPEPDSPAIPCEHISEKTHPPKGQSASPANRYSMATQDSTNSTYASDRPGSIDQVHLDRLRQSPRQSYASTGAKTSSTSRSSSLEHSSRFEFAEALEANMPSSRRASETKSAHRSLLSLRPREPIDRELDQAMPTPGLECNTAVVGQMSTQAVSPTTPNFSVPTFSKRYSMASSSSVPLVKAQISSVTVKLNDLRSESTPEHIVADRAREDPGGEPLKRPNSGSNPSKRASLASQSRAQLTIPPTSSDYSLRPSSVEGEPQYSRRHSSLSYARGILPIPLPKQSPSPHPPLTIALPPIPDSSDFTRRSSIPPPSGPLPPLPSSCQQSISGLPSKPAIRPLSSGPSGHATLLAPPSPPTHKGDDKSPKLRRPASMQVQLRPPTPPNAHHAPSIQTATIRFLSQDEPNEQATTPPKPTRPPPPPPVETLPSPSANLTLESMPGLGRQPMAASPPLTPAILSETPSEKGPPGETTPHPYIPPIRISDRHSNYLLDGPWNVNYGAPKRSFLDLTSD